ncbi:hypothetical protein BX600DRAFT_496943 [Xylariales sp. PMI_506]|nr:hypothetical protein BX600DRAFT_496943 [Xylariales sp. PMI_506]
MCLQTQVKVASSSQPRVELPYPAVKCVIDQDFEYFLNWGWVWSIFGAFYDANDRQIWATQIYVGCKAERSQQQQLLTGPVWAYQLPGTSTATFRGSGLQQDILAHPRSYQGLSGNYLPWTVYNPHPMANPNVGRGWNPTTGWDTGGLPPSTGAANPSGSGGYLVSSMYPPYGIIDASLPYVYGAPFIPGPPDSTGPVYTMPANGYQPAVPLVAGQPGRFPTAHPVVNAEAAALNLQNSTGGMGCEPGYNYYFPAEHTKIHVLKSRDPPWRLPAGSSLRYAAYHVPVRTTLGDLMKGFGATHPSAKRNRITEVVEGGSGRWYKGVTFAGNERDDMARTIKEIGWDMTRTGRPGEKPVVWLWVTKD